MAEFRLPNEYSSSWDEAWEECENQAELDAHLLVERPGSGTGVFLPWGGHGESRPTGRLAERRGLLD